MNTLSTSSPGKGSDTDKDKDKAAGKRDPKCGCDIDININCHGDVNIYNCSTPAGTGPATPPPPACPCPPIYGACLPAVPGAKHKQSRDHKLAKLAAGARVPSAFAAGIMHMARRFLLGKTPANALEAAAFASLANLSRDLLACSVAAFDAVPPRQRNRLFAPALVLGADQPLDESALTTALATEIQQRIGTQIFNDPQGAEQERPGRIRVYQPQGEDFYSQVRICTVNDLRVPDFVPALDIGAYLPGEFQQDCIPKIVDGQPQVVCQIRAANCPGFPLGNACARVPDIALGDGVVLQGVNYFSVDAKVRFIDSVTQLPVRDVDAHIFGDIETPVTEVVDGNTVLINDCRVRDLLSFRVPEDLAPAVYEIQVVVPNITGIATFGTELTSNIEYINVIPSASTRYKVFAETIIARKETSPSWFGSDEVGLHTLAFAMDLNFQPVGDLQEQKFKDIQDVDFDSGTRRDITRVIFEHDQPILGMLLVVLGDEIDSQHAYNQQITSSSDIFIDLVKKEAAFVGAGIVALGGAAALAKLGPVGAIIAAIAAAITLGIDLIIALWAPADPIIRDSIGLSVNDLAVLTSANAPAPGPRTFTSEEGIVVNVNKTIPPVKLPLEYHETREYVSDDEDSRYEITYRFNRVA